MRKSPRATAKVAISIGKRANPMSNLANFARIVSVAATLLTTAGISARTTRAILAIAMTVTADMISLAVGTVARRGRVYRGRGY